jgi:hypothetical protein
MRNHNSKPKYLKNLTGFPKKDTGSITLIESDNPLFIVEVYDYRGIFVGYMGRRQATENEVLNKCFRKKDENINSINIINGINEENSRTDIL